MLIRIVKNIAVSVAGNCLNTIQKFLLKDYFVVFCYHDISENPSEFSKQYGLNISPKLFDYQIDFIKSSFNIVHPGDFLEGRLPEKAALITFDDGFKSFNEYAVPILKTHNVPSILFINYAPVQGEVFWSGLITYLCEKSKDFVSFLEKELGEKRLPQPLYLSCSQRLVNAYLNKTDEGFISRANDYVGEFLSEKELRSLSDEDSIYFGNHLYNHFVPALMDDNEFVAQLNRNKVELNKYSNHINLFSFPFGQPGKCFTKRQVELLRQNDIEKAFFSSGGVNLDGSVFCYDRVALTSNGDSEAKIWFQILRHSLKDSFSNIQHF